MGRADCVSETHAIEIDWADKWHEGIGQALSYATATGLAPGLILVCRQEIGRCLSHSLSAREVFAVQGVAATVWECSTDDVSLADCIRREVGVTPAP